MRSHDSQMPRQYFFTALIMFCLLLISFIVLLVKIRPSTAHRGLGGIGISTVHNAGSGLDIVKYFVYFIVLIITLALLFIFDKYVLKRNAKNEAEYRTRRKLLAGAAFIALIMGAVLQLIR